MPDEQDHTLYVTVDLNSFVGSFLQTVIFFSKKISGCCRYIPSRLCLPQGSFFSICIILTTALEGLLVQSIHCPCELGMHQLPFIVQDKQKGQDILCGFLQLPAHCLAALFFGFPVLKEEAGRRMTGCRRKRCCCHDTQSGGQASRKGGVS